MPTGTANGTTINGSVVTAMPASREVAPGAGRPPEETGEPGREPRPYGSLEPGSRAPWTVTATVTGGLVAARVYPLLGNRRNSYCPGVDGIVTVQVVVVTPSPT